MKMLRYILAMLLISVIATSCNMTSHKISQLESLYIELRNNSENYTDQDWEKAMTKFETISNGLQQCRLTEYEHEKVGELKGKCALYFSQPIVDGLSKDFINLVRAFQGAINGIADEINNSPQENK